MEPIKIPSLTAGKFFIPEIIQKTVAATFGLDESALPFGGGYSLEVIFEEFLDSENNYFLSKKDLARCKKITEDSIYLHPESQQLKDLLMDFAYGFQAGYMGLEERMKPSAVFKETDKDVALKIFRSVFALSDCDHGVIHPLSEATEYLNQNNPDIFQSKLHFSNMGTKAGENYKALEIIIDHPILFEPIFKREFEDTDPVSLKEPSGEAFQLSLPQIALLFVYEDGGISRDNCDSTAEEYGWKAKTSGHKLYQYFNQFRENSERLGDPGSKIKLRNKINLLESVVVHLSDSASQRAQEEISQLKRLFDSRYE